MSKQWLSFPSKRWFSTATKHHVCLHNSNTAAQVAEAFVPAGTKDKVIIEAFPGVTKFLRRPVHLTDNHSCRTWNIDTCLVAVAEGTDTQDHCSREY